MDGKHANDGLALLDWDNSITYSVDHRIRYIPALANALSPTYTQNMTSMI